MDIKTMTLSYALISLIIFLSSFVIALYRKERYFTIFSCAFGATVIGTLLVTGQEVISPWLSIVIGNALILTHYMIVYAAIRYFFKDAKIWPRRFTALLIVFITIFYFATYIHYSYFIRVGTYSLFIIIILIDLLAYIKPRMNGCMAVVKKGLHVIILLHIAANALRAVLVILYSNDAGIYISNSVAPIILFASNTVNLILWFSVFMVLDSITQLEEIHEKNDLLTNMAQKDMLTGVYNRHYLEQNLHEFMALADRIGEPISFILLDLDHFKQINDQFGHAVGDEVLVTTAEVIQKMIRTTDRLIRWGGEEFLILALATKQDSSVALAEKIRSAVEHHDYETAGRVTASFGVAQRYYSESEDICFIRVDSALYRAKKTGRNRVVCWDEEEPLPIPLVKIEWSEQWRSGDLIIDNDHKLLLEMSNQLIESVFLSMPFEETLEQVALLVAHIVKHFEKEELRLRAIGYEDLDDHILSHKNLVAEAEEIVALYKNEKICVTEFITFLMGKVIIGHLLAKDTKFFKYTRSENPQ